MRRTLSRALMSLAFVFATGVGGVVAKDEPAPKGDAKDKPTAAGPSLHYARSYADAVAEAKDRGCALFITFHGDGWKHCVTMHRSVLENAEFAEWANENVVVVVGHSRGSHGSVDVAKPAKGEPKKQCSLYPGLTCDQHDQVWKDARIADVKDDAGDKDKAKKPASKKKDGPPPLPQFKLAGIPASFVILPDLTTVDHKADREPGTCRSFLEEELKKVEEHPIPASKWADVKAAWAEVEKASKAAKWKATLDAIAKTEAAAGGALPKSYAERIKEKVDAIDAKAVARLADAKKLKDPAAAAKAAAALKAEVDVKLASGPLPVVAAIDEFLSGAAGAAPAAKPEDAEPAK